MCNEVAFHGFGFGNRFIGTLAARTDENREFMSGFLLLLGKRDGAVEAFLKKSTGDTIGEDVATENDKIILVVRWTSAGGFNSDDDSSDKYYFDVSKGDIDCSLKEF